MKTETQVREELIEKANSDDEFRQLLLDDPRAAVRGEFGIDIPDGINLFVHEEKDSDFHVVLPVSGAMSPRELGMVTGGVDFQWDLAAN